jgi:hypothetical protein
MDIGKQQGITPKHALCGSHLLSGAQKNGAAKATIQAAAHAA